MKAIVFDKDGTLTPYGLWGPAIHEIFLKKLPLSRLSEERKGLCVAAFERMSGVDKDGEIYPDGLMIERRNRIPSAFRILFLTLRFGLNPFLVAKAILELKERWNYGYRELLEKSCGEARSILTSLRGKGYVLGLSTNDKTEAVYILKDALGHDTFAHITTGTSKPRKPSPKTLAVFSRETGIPMEEIAFVSDTSEDLLMARLAGVGMTIGIEGTIPRERLERHADETISSLRELDAIF